MKKALILLITVFALVIPAYAAVDVDLAANVNSTFFEFGIISKDQETSFPYKIAVEIESDIYFDRGSGMYVRLGYQQQPGITVAAGYAYTTPVGNMDLVLTVGPHFYFQGSNATLGADCKALFQTYFAGADGMFVRFGAALNIDFLDFGNSVEGYFNMGLVLPEFAIGYKF